MKVFIAGPRAIAVLDNQVEARIGQIMKKELTVLVGDADGVDRAIQNCLFDSHYQAVSVYASGTKPRNNMGNWPVVLVDAGKTKGFAFYAAKDLKMAEDADYGFMIWNGVSKGTLNNLINLTQMKKKSLVYFTPKQAFTSVDDRDKLNDLVAICGDATIRLYKTLLHGADHPPAHEQLALDMVNG